MKKVLTLAFVSIVMSFTAISASASVSEQEDDSKKSEVIAIVDGVEITRSDIDANGLINNDVFENIEQTQTDSTNQSLDPRYSIPPTLYVTKGCLLYTSPSPRDS